MSRYRGTRGPSRRTDLHAQLQFANGEKFCAQCQIIKIFSEFKPSAAYCIDCNKKRLKKWCLDNKDRFLDYRRAKLRRHHLKKAFGLTQSEWDVTFEAQDRKCAVCRRTDPGNSRGWGTDHDHRTGKFRGILCNNCNSALGYVKESAEILNGLIAYLAKHG